MPCAGCQRRRQSMLEAARRVSAQLRRRREKANHERRAKLDAVKAKRRLRT